MTIFANLKDTDIYKKKGKKDYGKIDRIYFECNEDHLGSKTDHFGWR